MSTPPANKARKKPGPDGTGTRQRLIAAALELFGQRGFQGVGAREIAAAGGAPLAAIPYHFGTKEALYRAALEEVRARLGSAIAPAASRARNAISGSPQEARYALAIFQGELLNALAVDPAAESWAKLLVREHLDPTDAFDLVYEDAAGQAVELIAALIAIASGRDAADPDVVVEAFAKMGEVLIFRVTQHAVCRKLRWRTFGPDEAAAVVSALGWKAADQL